jgi:hypothetical protein
MGGMQTCYWRQGELKRIIPGSHHKDDAYKALERIQIFYFHVDPEPIFHFNDDLDPVFVYILSESDINFDAASDPTFYSLDPGSIQEIEQIEF